MKVSQALQILGEEAALSLLLMATICTKSPTLALFQEFRFIDIKIKLKFPPNFLQHHLH